MIRRRNLLILVLLFFVLFIVTTNYLLSVLSSSESEVKNPLTVEEKIYLQLNELPVQYKVKSLIDDKSTNLFLQNFKKSGKLQDINLVNLWKEANSWVTKTQLVNLNSPNLGQVSFALKNARISKADVDTRGTQLKLLLTLDGNQQVVFKPKWYEINEIIEGPVYAGKDRYGSEIVGFYLSVILNKYLTPISVERKISLKKDIIPVATQRLLETIFEKNNRTCLYGKCFFCKKEDPVCEDQDFLLNGAVIFNINASLNINRSPWQRTYKKGRNALWQDFPETYCRSVREKLPKKRIYDLVDISIFDFLIQNGDRHHYETLGDTVIWLDNGKGLGNPNVHHVDILAPLYQCCILRRKTWRTLLGLTGGKLREKLESLPDIKKFITMDHLQAIEERLLIIFATVEYCRHHKELEQY